MIETRGATAGDAKLITAHRRGMFAAMGRGTEESLNEMCRTFEPWVTVRLADGRYLGWVAYCEGRPVGSAGLWIMDWPPVPHDPASTSRGYLLNVFVEPDFRRQGLARSLLDGCIAEGRKRGIRILSLHASHVGRPLYERSGFAASNEMQLRLGPE
jgi:GNAT superfamily N-acetyltransferase